MDSEDLLQCPYDKNHQIRPSRFPYHLVKCRENNVKAAKDLATCPYNARHRVPKQELKMHISNCSDKCFTESFQEISFNPKIQPPSKSKWQAPPCQEDWEDDDSSFASCPFILDPSATTFLEEAKRDHKCKRKGLQSPPKPTGWLPEPNPMKDGNGIGRGMRRENCSTPKHNREGEPFPAQPQFVQGTSGNSHPQNGQRDPRGQDHSKDFQSPSKPAGRVPEPNPWNGGNGIGRGRRLEQNASPTKHAQEGEASPDTPPMVQDTNTNNHHQNETRTRSSTAHVLNHHYQPPRRATKEEHKSPSRTGRTSPVWGSKPNPWKIDPVSSPKDKFSPSPIENVPAQSGQRVTRMEQTPSRMSGQTSPAWSAKSNPWKTGVSTPPPKFVPGTRENSLLPNAQRITRAEQQTNGPTGRSSSAWGCKATPWNTGFK